MCIDYVAESWGVYGNLMDCVNAFHMIFGFGIILGGFEAGLRI